MVLSQINPENLNMWRSSKCSSSVTILVDDLFLFYPIFLLLCQCSTHFREDCVMVASDIRDFQVVFSSLFHQEMLKCSKNSEGTAELEEALATVLDIIKSVNDSMHQIAITGYEVLFVVALTVVLTHTMFFTIMVCPWLVHFVGAFVTFLKDAFQWYVVVIKKICQHTCRGVGDEYGKEMGQVQSLSIITDKTHL